MGQIRGNIFFRSDEDSTNVGARACHGHLLRLADKTSIGGLNEIDKDVVSLMTERVIDYTNVNMRLGYFSSCELVDIHAGCSSNPSSFLAHSAL